jgi:hypothetical protein
VISGGFQPPGFVRTRVPQIQPGCAMARAVPIGILFSEDQSFFTETVLRPGFARLKAAPG